VRAFAIVLATLVMLSSARAEAQSKPLKTRKLPRRAAALEIRSGWVTLTGSWRDVVNRSIRKKLLSGLPTVIVTRAYVFPEGRQQPVGLSVRTCRIVFDLWDEVFRIELRQAGRRRKTVAVNVEGVLRRCAEGRRMPLVRARTLKAPTRHFVGVLVEVNPLSREMMERIRRWVSLPKGAGAVGPGDSLFGSFVGLFVTHVPAADRTLAFRTAPFVPAKLPIVRNRSK
jgi:hypothetical protein